LDYRSIHTGLTGPNLEALKTQLVDRLSSQITRLQDAGDDEWTILPDVYRPFIRNMAFRASVESLLGMQIFKLIPTFAEDFWAFDSHLPNLFKEMPRWVVPESCNARDKMKANIKHWEASAAKHYGGPDVQHEKYWEEYFGSRLMRTRHEMFTKMPLSREYVSGENLGLL
jgi:hypothetical protein